MNRNTYIFAIVAVLILLGVGVYQFKNKKNEVKMSEVQEQQTKAPGANSDSIGAIGKDLESVNIDNPDFTEIDSGLNEMSGGSAVSTSQTIIYTDKGFEPANLTIKAGETITFKNNSENKTWPASAIHPTHTVYPTTGGCLGSTFDACKGLGKGESWSFKFDVKGAWKYHDHLNPNFHGTITVQ